ncbi:hypothetical protein [Sphaerimonospora mesophila]
MQRWPLAPTARGPRGNARRPQDPTGTWYGPDQTVGFGQLDGSIGVRHV